MGELSEVCGRVGHGLVLAWFESYVLRLVFLDSSLQSPGQEKHFGILFIPLRVVVREYVCRDDNGGNGNQACMVFDFFFLFIAWHFETPTAPRKRERNILVPFL